MMLGDMQSLRLEASGLPNTVHHDLGADDYTLRSMKTSQE
jgi:hypothetical protein